MQPASFDPEQYTNEGRDAWDTASAAYDKMSSTHFSEMTHAFLEFVGVKPGATVLDVACGPGTTTLAAAEKAGPSGKVAGVDLAPGMVSLASRKAAARGITASEFRTMNAEALDFPEHTFDLVICQLGLMLFAKPSEALKEMVRVAKRKGLVACLVQGLPEKMIFTSLPMKTLLKHAPETKTPGAPSLYSFAPPGVLEAAFQQAGLTNIDVQRKQGILAFASAADYWETLADSAGRLRATLKNLSPMVREAIQNEVLAGAQAFRKGDHLEMPYEVVMAKGTKS